MSEKDAIQESLQEFREGLQSAVPLRHFGEHQDEARIRDVAQKETDKVLGSFVKKMEASKYTLGKRADLFKELCSELEKSVEEYVTKNQDSKKESESFLTNRIEISSEDFRTSIEAKFLMNPDMDLKTVEEFFETGKPKAADYFGHLWKHGNVGGFEEQKTKLEETLDALKKEMLEKQSSHLKVKSDGEASRSIEELKENESDLIIGVVQARNELVTSRNELVSTEMRQDKGLKGVIGSEEVTVLGSHLNTATTTTHIKPKDRAILGKVIKRAHQEDLEETSSVRTPPTLKSVKFTVPDHLPEEGTVGVLDNDNTLNVPNEVGHFPLLRAIADGQSVDFIKNMLDDGANVNIKTIDGINGNAAHEVIMSLMDKKMTPQNALAILDLLVSKGFKLLNEADASGFTPLLHIMQYEGLTEELLNWFHENGAKFNAAETQFANSVLSQAIHFGQDAGIIRKIIEYGGRVDHLNWYKQNFIHKAAKYAHQSALEIFIDHLDVNAIDIHNQTPLHLLFCKDDLDYQACLEILLRNGANFCAETPNGFVPLVLWIKYGRGNIFPTLMKTKDKLPITPEIASSALTAIVQEVVRKEEFLPFPTRKMHHEFVPFIIYLIDRKKAKLRLKDEALWKQQNWGNLNKAIFTNKFFQDLKSTGRVKCKGKFFSVAVGELGYLNIYTYTGHDLVRVETILAALLTSHMYKVFWNVSRLLEKFCAEPVSPKK